MLDFRENPRARGFAADRLFSLFARFLMALIPLCAQIHSFRVCLSAYRGQKRKLRFPFLQVIILIINCAFQNRYFGLAHPICRILATSAGECARVNNMRALINRAQRAEPSIRRKSQPSARREFREPNIYSRQQNHTFAPAHSICRYLGSRKG